MPTNDFKPFAADGAANVIPQSGYTSLPALVTGFQAGEAFSAQCNKVWRQSSIIAAVIGQFIVDKTGEDAVDDGTIGTLLSQLEAAIAATLGSDDDSAYATLSDLSAYAPLSGFANSLGSNGYQKLPGGLIIQWVKGAAATTEASQAVTLPITFPSACLMAFATENIPSFVDEANAWFQVLSFTASAVTVQAQATLTSWSGSVYPNILAIGH